MRGTRAQFARRKKFMRRVGMTRHVRWDGSVVWVRVDRARWMTYSFYEPCTKIRDPVAN